MTLTAIKFFRSGRFPLYIIKCCKQITPLTLPTMDFVITFHWKRSEIRKFDFSIQFIQLHILILGTNR